MLTNQKIAFVTTCPEKWGGSEELWAKAIPYLIDAGNSIIVCKRTIHHEHPAFKKLASLGVTFFEWKDIVPTQNQNITEVKTLVKKIVFKKKTKPSPIPIEEVEMVEHLKNQGVNLVVISQGMNFDGNSIGYLCLRENIPYVFIAQKAVEIHWPAPYDRMGMRNVLYNAQKLMFISKHNLRLTEEQFGVSFPNAQLLFNPIKVKREARPYPSTEAGYKLACIGRYFLLDKGQDMLLRVLAQEKWKQRPISVSFIGGGVDKAALQEMATFIGATNVEFLDHVSNIETLWDNYHALVLASRFEGMPLVLLEAMASGRTAIVTNAGGNAEIVEDNHTGFIAEANERDLDIVLEKAWQNKDAWKQMGLNALEKIKAEVPEVPEKELAESLLNHCEPNPELVSVIIPTYNRATIVENAIKSVLNQTYPHIQLIVADDGSSDNTEEIMAKYPQVTYLKLEHGGQSHARNEGLRHSKGYYVASLDSDDTWDPRFVERSVELIRQHNADFCFSNWLQQMEDNSLMERFSICDAMKDIYKKDANNFMFLDNKELRDIYLTSCPSPTSSLLIKRSSLRSKWTPGLRIADDWCLLMDMIYTSKCTAVVNKEMMWNKKVDGKNIYDGRKHQDIIRDLMVNDLDILFRRLKNHFTAKERKKFQEYHSQQYIYHFYYEIRSNKNISSFKHLYTAFKKNKKVAFWAYRVVKKRASKVLLKRKM